MVGVKFSVAASLVLASLDLSLASPAMRYGLNHWGGFGSLVRMGIKNPDPAGVEFIASSGDHANLGSSSPPGVPGNVMVVDKPEALPFYILDNQLYQVQNSTSILFVNVVNSTDSATTPKKLEPGQVTPGYEPNQRSMSVHTRMPTFKLVLSPKAGGYGGKWMWDDLNDAIAFQARGSDYLRGRFYSCSDRGVYVALDESTQYPVMCQPIKLW